MTRCKAFRRFGRAVALILATSVVLAGARPLAAQPAGTAFTYQGRLSDNGTPVTGTYDLQFALFTASAGGTQVGLMLSLGDVAVVGGLFTVNLDFGVGAFPGSARFLEIGVRPGASTGAYTLLGARQELKPSPQAVFSQTSPWAGLTGKPAGFADDVDNDSGGDITGVAVGLGMSGGGTAGAIAVGLDFSTIAANHNHFAQNWDLSSGNAGLAVRNQDSSGLIGQTSGPMSNGVVGIVSNLGNFFAGVAGITNGNSGIGVSGSASGTMGAGVRGIASATAGTPLGVEGRVVAPSGTGVRGVNTATTGAGVGVVGSADSPTGIGVDGSASASSGLAIGVRGLSGSSAGRGVFGWVPAPTGNTVGVRGEASSTAGIGVEGVAPGTTGATVGVSGQIFSAGGRAVWGRAPSPAVGHAGWFDGSVNVVGTLSKSAGSFKIDHPLDPENKYLYHSFVESPEMMNVYAGNVTTDADGFATVSLPDWFEALNRDFRYQLTVLDDGDSAGFVQVKVTRKIAENRFTIRTSTPRVEVSWLVTGVRKDAYAEKHRIPVEEWKAARDRGRYIHAAEWGRPPERGEGWERQQREDERPAPPSPDRD